MKDPVHDNPDRRPLAHVLHADPVEIRSPADAKRVSGDNRLSIHDRWFEHSPEPVTVPDTPYYRQMLAQRTLMPANKETAKALGVKFEEPSPIILETAKQAAKAWAREHDGEIPEWAREVDVKDMHASHATHVKFLAAHLAKIPAVAIATHDEGDA
jgi:hypothetical protein